MIRFKEDTDADKRKFAQILYKQFYIDGKWKFSGNEIAKIDGWPEKLDIENFELYAAGEDFVCFVAGGDWQQMVKVSVVKSFNKNILRIDPFYDYQEMSKKSLQAALEHLRIVCSE
jgi:hypothetical protein